ncbi:MAG: aminotransferase class V-fold PLP-dependent enzyme [Planctomycetota bacterium]
MNDPARYLDHAATSWPKPAAVVDAVRRWHAEVGVSAERGDGPGHRIARAEVAAARAGVAELAGVTADRVAFCSGATEGLNLALRALLRPGDRVVATAFEHSSVARPLVALARERGCVVHVVAPDPHGAIPADAFAAAIAAAPTALLALNHASNVTGAIVDAAPCIEAARAAGARSLLDACQTVGLLPIALGADVVVASCHKSLLAPPGVGFVAVRAGLDLLPQKHGGSGSSSALDEHPTAWPTAFEAGTPNTPALFGLAAALRTRPTTMAPQRLAAALARVSELTAALQTIAGIEVLAAPATARMPLLAFRHARYEPAEIGAIASQEGFTVRSGHLCAPWIHRHLGTEAAGVVRVSPGPETPAATIRDFAALLAGL